MINLWDRYMGVNCPLNFYICLNFFKIIFKCCLGISASLLISSVIMNKLTSLIHKIFFSRTGFHINYLIRITRDLKKTKLNQKKLQQKTSILKITDTKLSHYKDQFNFNPNGSNLEKQKEWESVSKIETGGLWRMKMVCHHPAISVISITSFLTF